VKFPSGANHPEDYEVLGTIDVFIDGMLEAYINTDKADDSGVLYYGTGIGGTDFKKQGRRMTAVDYAVHGYEGYSMILYEGYPHWGGMGQAQFSMAAARILEKYAAHEGIAPDSEEYKKYYDWSSADKKTLIADWSSTAQDPNMLNKQFGDEVDTASGDRSAEPRLICKSGPLINALVMILSLGDKFSEYLWAPEGDPLRECWFDFTDSDWQTHFDKWCDHMFDNESVMTIEDFIAEEDADYRILCEPGMICSSKDHTAVFAATMRDIFRFAQERDDAATADGDDLLWCYSNIIRQRLAYSLHQTCDEFWTYDRDVLGAKKAEGLEIGDALTEAFNAVKDEQNEMFKAVPDDLSGASSPSAKNYYKAVRGESASGLVANGAYDLGILAPYTFIADWTDETNLEIKKKSNLTGGNKWHFTIELKDADGNPISDTYDGVTFDGSGKATIELGAGESKKIKGLPLNCQVTVTEDDADPSYVTKVNGTDGTTWSETLSEKKTYTVEFDNSTDTPSEFRVTKTVTGAGDKSKEWEFEVKFDGDTTGATYTIGGTDTPVSGSTVTFKLKHGETAVFHNLDSSVKYTVTEKEANSDGYTTSPGTSINGTVGDNPSAAFTNDKPDEPGPGQDAIYKLDSKTNEFIGPATFHLEGQSDDGKMIKANYRADASGKVAIQWTNPNSGDGTYCPPGQYTVTELIPPPGYTLNHESQHLVLNKDGTCSGPLVFKNDKKIPIELLKTDSTGNPLPGAIFDVYKDGKQIDTIQSGADGIARFYGRDGDGLSEGLYEFVEIMAPAGYVIPKEHSVSVHVDPTDLDTGSPIHVSMKNWESTIIKIYKGVNGTNEPLAGASFEVMIDGTNIGTFGPTETDGYITIDTSVEGKYLSDYEDGWTLSVRETVPPDGYLLDDDQWQVIEVEGGRKEVVVPFTDTKYPDIKITKRDVNSRELLDGAVFEVFIDGTSIGDYETKGGEAIIDYATYGRFLKDNGTDELNFTVGVQEKTAPDGYLINDTGIHEKRVTRGDKLIEFEFDDTKYPEIWVRKLDAETGVPLADCRIQLTIDGQPFDGTITTVGPSDDNPDGWVKITYEEYKRYLGDIGGDELISKGYTITATELEMPHLYNKDKQEGSMAGQEYTLIRQLEPNASKVTFTFEDTHYRTVKVRKLDNETGWGLQHAQFHLYSDVLDEPLTGADGIDRYGETDEDGWVVFEDLPNGWYWLEEVKAPNGYDINGWWDGGESLTDQERRSTKMRFQITSDSAHGNETDDRVLTFTRRNEPMTGLRILKRDLTTGAPIAGAIFRVTPLGNNPGEPKEITTNTEGVAIIEEGLERGSYNVEEIYVPEPYVLDSTVHTITIVNQHDAFEMELFNRAKGVVYIQKLDAVTHQPLAGAYFEIRTGDGALVANSVGPTDSSGYTMWGPLEPGKTYVVQEIKSPDGHILDDHPQYFEVPKDASGFVKELVFDNTPLANLWLKKIDAETGLPLQGAVFEIYKGNGEIVKQNAITDAEGFIKINNLDPGTYFAKETKAPTGYVLDETEHKIVLTSHSTEVVTDILVR